MIRLFTLLRNIVVELSKLNYNLEKLRETPILVKHYRETKLEKQIREKQDELSVHTWGGDFYTTSPEMKKEKRDM